MSRIISIIILSCLLWGGTVVAQDVHYSQFYNMPLFLNPSSTGHFEGTYRVQALYRNQWNSITAGGVYATPALAADVNIKLGKKSPHSVGVGLAVLNDRTGGGAFNNTVALASAAFHAGLGQQPQKKAYVSVGIQGGLISRRIDQNALTFGSDLNGSGTAENFKANSLSFADLNAGATIAYYPSNRANLKIGISFLHLLGGVEEFLESTEENKNPFRFNGFIEGALKTKNEKFRWLPSLLYMTQANVIELNFTSNFGYQLRPDVELVFGAGYRSVDAFIANIGVNYKGFQVLGTYDINTSKLTPASNANGAFEIGIGYIGQIRKEVKPQLPCVRYF